MAFWVKTRHPVSAAAVIVSLFGSSAATGGEDEAAEGFEHATIRFEQNLSDADLEVVFEVKGDDEGLSRLRVTAPDGRTVADFSAPDASTLGLRQFIFESPEPRRTEALKAAYPEGTYQFSGTTVGGEELRGTCNLSHALPAAVSLVAPKPEATGVQIEGLQIRWEPLAGAAGYILEIEQDELGLKLVVELPAATTAFAPPAGLLLPDTEYTLGIAATAANGNRTFVETTFTTAD